MTLRFYYGSGSPYAWRVWLALEHKTIPYELQSISFADRQHKTPDYLAINPRGKVPAIVDGDFALYESAAILEYLDERFPDGPSLFPGDIRGRAVVRRLVQESDHCFMAALDPLLRTVLFTPRERWDEAAIAAAREGFAAELRFWETGMGDAFLAGAQPSAADFTLYPHIALGLRIDKRKPDVDVAGLVGPRFGAWMRRVEALPFLERTIPPHWRPRQEQA
jgi:glutathione S-transferase